MSQEICVYYVVLANTNKSQEVVKKKNIPAKRFEIK